MAIGFLLLITLDRAESLLLKAVLDNVNLMSLYIFCFIFSKLTTKIQKKCHCSKIIRQKVA